MGHWILAIGTACLVIAVIALAFAFNKTKK